MSTFLDLRLVELLDILILSYLIHRVIVLFQGTRAVQVALTLGLLWVARLLVRDSELVLTGWFFELIFANAALIIIVIFRHEIREVLAQSNPLRLFIGRPEPVGAIRPHLISEAVFHLAKSMTGALLVFQNRDRLTELAREGIYIDARFTAPLIESLFSKESPLHDGAAILRGGRIERAGTILPLSIRPGLPSEFGTRHRAAVGLSESCDAVVVVVSEERGEVSLVHRGQIEPVEDPETLERSLKRLVRGSSLVEMRIGPSPEFVRQGITFAATFVAVLALWGFYSSQDVSQKSVTIPVDFRGLPPNLELVNAPNEIDISVEGRQFRIDNLSAEQLAASVELAGVRTTGRHQVQEDELKLSLPAGVRLALDPSFEVWITERVEKAVRIEPVVVGEPPPGYQVQATAEPEEITLRVLKEDQGGLEAIQTRDIDLGELGLGPDKAEATVEVPLQLAEVRARPLVNGAVERVKVTVRLVPEEESQGEAEGTPDGGEAP